MMKGISGIMKLTKFRIRQKSEKNKFGTLFAIELRKKKNMKIVIKFHIRLSPKRGGQDNA